MVSEEVVELEGEVGLEGEVELEGEVGWMFLPPSSYAAAVDFNARVNNERIRFTSG